MGAVTPTLGKNMIPSSLLRLSQAHSFGHHTKAAGALLFNKKKKWG